MHAYRARGIDPLVQVEVCRLGTQKPARVQVRFIDEAAEGRVEWVPPARLKCAWEDVDAFRLAEERWARIDDAGISDDEPTHWALSSIFEKFLSGSVVHFEHRHGGALRILDLAGLAKALDVTDIEIEAYDEAFQDDGDWILPASASVQIARRVCELQSDAVASYLRECEEQAERDATYGRTYRATKNWPEMHTDAEDCARYDEEDPYGRPSRDVIRSWCDVDRLERRDEIVALRQEVRRLGALVDRSIATLRLAGAKAEANMIEQELGVPVELFRGK